MIKKKETTASLVDSQQSRRNLVYDRIVVAAIFNFLRKKLPKSPCGLVLKPFCVSSDNVFLE